MTLINYFFILMFFRVLEFISAVEPSHLTPAPALDFFFWLRVKKFGSGSSQKTSAPPDSGSEKQIVKICSDGAPILIQNIWKLKIWIKSLNKRRFCPKKGKISTSLNLNPFVFHLPKKGAGANPKYWLRLQLKNFGSDRLRLRNTENYTTFFRSIHIWNLRGHRTSSLAIHHWHGGANSQFWYPTFIAICLDLLKLEFLWIESEF